LHYGALGNARLIRIAALSELLSGAGVWLMQGRVLFVVAMLSMETIVPMAAVPAIDLITKGWWPSR